MHREGEHIDYERIAKYLSGELSGQDLIALEDWIHQSPDNKVVIEECRKIFSLSYQDSTASNPAFDKVGAWEKVLYRIKETTVVELAPAHRAIAPIFKRPWVRIAALMILVLSASLYFIKTRQGQTVILAAADEVREIMLPDSSIVVLKPLASISYTSGFGVDNRSIILNGTAYFDVKRDETLLFSVQAGIGTIEVLGTAFMIEELEEAIAVTVERGRVTLQSNKDARVKVVLNRNEKGLLIASEGINQSVINSLNSLYWANKTLAYRQGQLSDVFKELEVIFAKKIQFNAESIKNCRISAVFKDENFESIMSNLALSLNFEYTIAGNVVTVTSDGCQEN